MFVSKAAVVGGGTMGGEIAQAIAAADIPVLVKDIDQKFVDAALEKARAVTEGQLGRLVKKEKLTQEQADARLAEVMGNVTGTTTYVQPPLDPPDQRSVLICSAAPASDLVLDL